MTTSSTIQISIIFPLIIHRGQARKCFNSWSKEQTYFRDCYEMILISDGSEPKLERELKSRLLPHDQFIITSTLNNPIDIYNQAANQAKGQWLLLCESHSRADPRCVEELFNFVLNNGLDGACCHSNNILLNNFQKMEEKMFDDATQVRLQTDHWNKIYLRGSLVKRSVFLELGGLHARYGLFAEALLGVLINKHCYKLGYAKNAIVNHFNNWTLHELIDAVSDYTEGESRYYGDYPQTFNEPYFSIPNNWGEQGWLDRQLIYYTWVSMGKSLLKKPKEGSARYIEWLTVFPLMVFGPKWNYLKMKALVYFATWHCRFVAWNERLLWKKYEYLYKTLLVNRSQFRYLVSENKAENNKYAHLQLGVSYCISMLSARCLWGFYPKENYNNILFCWTKPVATLKLIFSPDNYQLCLTLAPVHPFTQDLQIFINGKLIKNWKLLSLFELQIPINKKDCNSSSFQYLVICSPVLQPTKHGSTDNRLLGLPLSSMKLLTAPIVLG